MKNFKITILAMLFLSLNLQGQKTPKGDYKFKIRTADKKVYFGYLTAINDSEMTLKKYRRLNVNKDNKEFTIAAKNIKTIKFRKKGKVLYSAFIGGGIGFFTGVLFGCIQSSSFFNFNKGQTIIIYGVPYAMTGFGVGAMVGIKTMTINLNRNQKRFKEEKKRLENYILKDR